MIVLLRMKLSLRVPKRLLRRQAPRNDSLMDFLIFFGCGRRQWGCGG